MICQDLLRMLYMPTIAQCNHGSHLLIAAFYTDGTVVSGLAVSLPLWLEHAPDFSGSLFTRQNAAALLQLLQLRHHPAVSGLMVQGVPVEDASAAAGGRVTRSRAKQQGGLKYSQVGLVALLLWQSTHPSIWLLHILGQCAAWES